jgi:ABC-type nitrate/sulfonate/bicarbonate transport system permease component
MGGHPAVKGEEKMRRRPWLPKAARSVLQFLLPFLVVGALWEVLARSGILHLAHFPAPSQIVERMWALFEQGVLWKNIAQSLRRMLIGYLAAIGVGVTAGALLALQDGLRETFAPLISMLMSVPTIAWVPVLLISMGLGDRTVITAVFLGGVFAITFNTMRGIEMVSKDHINAGRIMGVRGAKIFFSILLPASLVSVITGLRLGVGYSWRALVGGEMLAAMVEWGVGKMIFQARFWNDVQAMFVGLMVIGIISFLIERVLLKWLERATVEKWGMLAKR